MNLEERMNRSIPVMTTGELPNIISELQRIVNETDDDELRNRYINKLDLYRRAYAKAVRIEIYERDAFALVALVLTTISLAVYYSWK